MYLVYSFVLHGGLYNQALADVRSTGSGIKCRYCSNKVILKEICDVRITDTDEKMQPQTCNTSSTTPCSRAPPPPLTTVGGINISSGQLETKHTSTVSYVCLVLHCHHMAASLCSFEQFRSLSWHNFKIMPDVKLPWTIRYSVICNCAIYNIHDISFAML